MAYDSSPGVALFIEDLVIRRQKDDERWSQGADCLLVQSSSVCTLLTLEGAAFLCVL